LVRLKKNNTGWECGTYRIKEKCIPDSDNMKERDHLEDLGVDGNTML
jgi:hypothetical protein